MAAFLKRDQLNLDDLLRKEFKTLKAIFNSRDSVSPGLHTYHVRSGDKGAKRLHLRVTESGEGILFVDVTDVIRAVSF